MIERLAVLVVVTWGSPVGSASEGCFFFFFFLVPPPSDPSSPGPSPCRGTTGQHRVSGMSYN
jgi:hypothetical protein